MVKSRSNHVFQSPPPYGETANWCTFQTGPCLEFGLSLSTGESVCPPSILKCKVFASNLVGILMVNSVLSDLIIIYLPPGLINVCQSSVSLIHVYPAFNKMSADVLTQWNADGLLAN